MTSYTERFPRGTCQQNAKFMKALHPELAIVDGYLVVTASDGHEFRIEHTWNATADGLVIDSTELTIGSYGLPWRYEVDPDAWRQHDARLADLATKIAAGEA